MIGQILNCKVWNWHLKKSNWKLTFEKHTKRIISIFPSLKYWSYIFKIILSCITNRKLIFFIFFNYSCILLLFFFFLGCYNCHFRQLIKRLHSLEKNIISQKIIKVQKQLGKLSSTSLVNVIEARNYVLKN